jgi:hypothetical protein
MLINILLYLFEASVGVTLLALIFRMVFSTLTFFQWNRIFILTGTVICMVLPFIPVSGLEWDGPGVGSAVSKVDFHVDSVFFSKPVYSAGSKDDNGSFSTPDLLIVILIFTYFSGLVLRTIRLFKGLFSIEAVRRSSKLYEEHADHKIYLQDRLPTFSFGERIFLNCRVMELDPFELQQVISHELVHIQRLHTLDLLFMEVASIVLWFNPGIHYLSKLIREVHEYQVDENVTSGSFGKFRYGQLLVKLTDRQNGHVLVHSFSESQLVKRLKMLFKQKSSAMQKFRFLILIPLVCMVVLLCSFFAQPVEVKDDFVSRPASDKVLLPNQMKIGKITWQGNKQFTSAELSEVLSFKAGDIYDSARLESSMNEPVGGKNITSMYMDNGYLFFRVETEKEIQRGKVNLTMKIYEGQRARIRALTVKGNEKIGTSEIIELLRVKTGEIFDRSKIMASQAALAKSGKFDSRNIIVNPVPDHTSFGKGKEGFVDFEFVVTEL